MTSSIQCAATSVMRRPSQELQMPRALHENATTMLSSHERKRPTSTAKTTGVPRSRLGYSR